MLWYAAEIGDRPSVDGLHPRIRLHIHEGRPSTLAIDDPRIVDGYFLRIRGCMGLLSATIAHKYASIGDALYAGSKILTLRSFPAYTQVLWVLDAGIDDPQCPTLLSPEQSLCHPFHTFPSFCPPISFAASGIRGLSTAITCVYAGLAGTDSVN